ncbi:mucin-3A [Phycodurus eques]|uniref:mucin-3A n=1 Tax=Phycodurus eques TaxID=693459 RepID=UPI002ACE8244|nr:mucin-3A [Phycodurus eques]
MKMWRRLSTVLMNATVMLLVSFSAINTQERDSSAIPSRKVNITLDVKIGFMDSYYDLLSPESIRFIDKLLKELEVLCKTPNPQAFEKVEVIKLLPSGVSATSRAQYAYENNGTQIHWLNTQLHGELEKILSERENIQQISQAFDNASVLFKEVVPQIPEINNVTDIQPFVDCLAFANYTPEVIEGQWQCVGPCKTSPDYCNGHGQCLNDIRKGAVCRCYESNIRQYYGQRCERYRRGPGFYGALFGSLAAVVLLVAIVLLIVFLVKKGRFGTWKGADSSGFIDFEEDYFDFTDTGHRNLGLAGGCTAESFRPRLENVDTQMQVRTKRPEVLNVSFG